MSSDNLKVGDIYLPLTISINNNINRQYIDALEDNHPRYKNIVHPGILLCLCSITRSPSFYLDNNIEAVGAKFKAIYHNTIEIDKKFTIHWKITDVYRRRSRKYQSCKVSVIDEDGILIIEREIVNTFVGGRFLNRRVEWEKATGYRKEAVLSEFPEEGYEIVGRSKNVSANRIRCYSCWSERNIHTDRDIAIRAGIGKQIASGMMIESYLVELMVSYFGENWLTNGNMSVTSIDMTTINDKIIPKAIVKNGANLGIWCENQHRHKVMVGEANCLMKTTV